MQATDEEELASEIHRLKQVNVTLQADNKVLKEQLEWFRKQLRLLPQADCLHGS